MSLHTIPLCNFKYAGDNICSGATFKYDTRAEIINYTPKLLSLNNQNNVNKVESQLFSGSSMGNMLKSAISILNKNSGDLIDRPQRKSMYVPKKEILKNNTSPLKEYKSEIFKHYSKMFRTKGENIFITNNNILKKSQNINLTKSIDLQLKKSEDIYISITYSKLVKAIRNFAINISSNKNLYNIKAKDFLKVNYKVLNAISDLELNLCDKKYLSNSINREIFKNNSTVFNTLNRYRDINKLVGELLRRNVLKEIFLEQNRNFYDRYTLATINKDKKCFYEEL